MKVAIVCDWLIYIGGAERVVLELHNMFPDAPIYTSQYDPRKMPWFENADVRTLWLQKLPKSLRKFLPTLRAWAFSSLDLSEYDLVLSSSSAEAKGIKTGDDTLHINYCHSPTHYYWVRYEEYIKNPGFGPLNWLARFGLRLLVGPMRLWDRRAAKRPDYMIANSSYTKDNIKKYYGRDSEVIHPPVNVAKFKPGSEAKRLGYITVGHQRPYMRRDLAIEVCTALDIPLTVIGNGPEHNKLVALAGPSIRFLTDVSTDELPKHLQSAEAFIFPAKEDFGISATEALAAGTPVIAFKAGGAMDYVKPGVNGEFFTEQSVKSLTEALKSFDSEKFESKTVQSTAKPFSIDSFHKKIRKLIKEKL